MRPTVIESPMPAKAEPARFRPLEAAFPIVGANCHLHCRHYPETGILSEGRRIWGHTAKRIKMGACKFTQLQNTLHDGRAYCCFVWDYLGELARDYNDCGSVLLDALGSGLYNTGILGFL